VLAPLGHAAVVTAPATVDARSWARRLAVVAGLVVYTIWDEALLSSPVVASVGWIGAWPTFLAFAALYGSGGFVLSLLVVRAYARRLGGETSRLERWVEREAHDGRQGWARRLLLRSGWVGFAVASFALGPIVTTWLLYASGRFRTRIAGVALASSAIFGATFVAPYCGLGRLLFGS
jgi:hypothetical protein